MLPFWEGECDGSFRTRRSAPSPALVLLRRGELDEPGRSDWKGARAAGASRPPQSGPALRALRWPGKGPVWPPRPQPADVDSGSVAVATGGHSARRKCTMGSVGDRGEHAATTHRQRRADYGRAPRPPILGVGSRRQLDLGVIAPENLANPNFPRAPRVLTVTASASTPAWCKIVRLKSSRSRAIVTSKFPLEGSS